MTDPRYDGSVDAPPARGILCVEDGCGQGRVHENHDDANDHGHFFNGGDGPLVSKRETGEPPRSVALLPTRETLPTPLGARPVRPKRPHIPAAKREEIARRGKDTRQCVKCGKVRGSHRGMIDHKFVPPGAETTAIEFVSPTTSQITEAVENALRGMGIAPRIRFRSTTVKPQYSADSDTELLSANVLVDLALIFPRAS